jgi:hypothetical protein
MYNDDDNTRNPIGCWGSKTQLKGFQPGQRQIFAAFDIKDNIQQLARIVNAHSRILVVFVSTKCTKQSQSLLMVSPHS